MAVEIERKFLILKDQWLLAKQQQNLQGSIFKQAYLNSTPERTVRVRIQGKQAFLTIKSKNSGISRQEFEYPIPTNEAEELLLLCETPALEKIRYQVNYQDRTWEVDEFHGENQGLIVAEIELQTETEEFCLPPWLDREVSNDPRYFNSQLSKYPFSSWAK